MCAPTQNLRPILPAFTCAYLWLVVVLPYSTAIFSFPPYSQKKKKKKKSHIWYFLIEQYLRKVPICTPPSTHLHAHPYIVFQTMMSFLVYDWDGRHASEDDFLGSAYMVLSEVGHRHFVGTDTTFCYNRTNCINRLGKSPVKSLLSNVLAV